MWSHVEKISQRDESSAVVLTTHSMDEVEALSTKMGVMVRGGIFKCFGDAKHIKKKFSSGYEIEIKIRKPTMDELVPYMKSKGMGGSIHEMVCLKRANPKLDCPIILDQLRNDGIGSYLCSEAINNDGNVRTSAFINYCFIQENAMRFIGYLCQNFGYVELMEHCGNYFKLRIPSNDTSIGFIFSRIQSLK